MCGLFARELRHSRVDGAGGSHINANSSWPALGTQILSVTGGGRPLLDAQAVSKRTFNAQGKLRRSAKHGGYQRLKAVGVRLTNQLGLELLLLEGPLA